MLGFIFNKTNSAVVNFSKNKKKKTFSFSKKLNKTLYEALICFIFTSLEANMLETFDLLTWYVCCVKSDRHYWYNKKYVIC